MANSKAAIIRAKKLGVLIRDARQDASKSIEECANALGVSSETFQAYEYGEKSPSLPELEVLAYYLSIHVDHFWGKVTLTQNKKSFAELQLDRLIPLRHKMIGASVRKARQDTGLELESAAEQIGIPAEELESYELGQKPVPAPVLESLGKLLGQSVEDFMDQRGPVGVWMVQQRGIQGFLDLDSDLQEFVAKPINRPYLELAMRLSGLPVERLRNIAEGLLEITL